MARREGSARSGVRTGHAITLVLSIGVILLSVIITPSTGYLDLFGVTIPELCSWKILFGVECLGCGMTRSFVFIGHGDPRAAWEMNHLGPVLYAIVLFQIPYRGWLLWRRPVRPADRESLGSQGSR